MFPHPEDRLDYEYPEDGLLQAYGVVKDNEIRQPQNMDVNGRVNGLESFTRIYPDYGIGQTSIDTAILPYGKRGPFSAQGDSGSIILARDGRIVALLTGGGGSTDETDVTYGTPYWWLQEQIKEAFPGCHLYQDIGETQHPKIDC